MNKEKIAITIIATNIYFVLGIRFIKKFLHHYKGDKDIVFYFFSDTNPQPYLSEHINHNVVYIYQKHSCWRDATNSKYKNIIYLTEENFDYIYYFDADTNIVTNFTENWFIGELVAGEHHANRKWMKDQKYYDRNPNSKAYISYDTKLPQTYYYGAFWGGIKSKVIEFCHTMIQYQEHDTTINYEPVCNDESYLNCYFHFNPPEKVVSCDDFKFIISDKGGFNKIREEKKIKEHIEKYLDKLKQSMLDNKNNTYDIVNKEIKNVH